MACPPGAARLTPRRRYWFMRVTVPSLRAAAAAVTTLHAALPPLVAKADEVASAAAEVASVAPIVFEPRGITPEDTVIFIIGCVPFVWAGSACTIHRASTPCSSLERFERTMVRISVRSRVLASHCGGRLLWHGPRLSRHSRLVWQPAKASQTRARRRCHPRGAHTLWHRVRVGRCGSLRRCGFARCAQLIPRT